LVVRTDFTDEHAWQRIVEEAQKQNEDGFQAFVIPISDATFDQADWRAITNALPDERASVLFIVDSTTVTSPEHPILVVNLERDATSDPIRCIPPELWGIENNLNLSNMDWHEFADAVDSDGVFRGFS
jgi:hypothetical protein